MSVKSQKTKVTRSIVGVPLWAVLGILVVAIALLVLAWASDMFWPSLLKNKPLLSNVIAGVISVPLTLLVALALIDGSREWREAQVSGDIQKERVQRATEYLFEMSIATLRIADTEYFFDEEMEPKASPRHQREEGIVETIATSERSLASAIEALRAAKVIFVPGETPWVPPDEHREIPNAQRLATSTLRNWATTAKRVDVLREIEEFEEKTSDLLYVSEGISNDSYIAFIDVAEKFLNFLEENLKG
jgi:hypothetical protein